MGLLDRTKRGLWSVFVRRHEAVRLRKRLLAVLGIVAVLAVGLLFFRWVTDSLGLGEREVLLGATFSKSYAEELGLDWEEAYLATLDDLGVRALRIPVYWTDIEEEKGEFDFSVTDWQLKEASDRNVKVVLAVGMKLPRWPECHIPEWAKGLSQDELHLRTLNMLAATVDHYSKSPHFAAWQVENEPFFAFGECPPPDRHFLQREIAVVRSKDSRPVIITESGELSTWVSAASVADILGISTYRSVWNRYIGYFFWPVTPGWYAQRISAATKFVDGVFVSELQAEPWGPGPIADMDIELQLKHMNPQKLRDNVVFVRRMGVPEAYLWGVEWWYWLKEQGHPEMWEEGRKLFRGDIINGGTFQF
ncbi:MAG: hypothetical protein U9Q03_03370 [Patescibacteria group bacterium]|nr:hypothetical protein [Patescibacteria group bacterium]